MSNKIPTIISMYPMILVIETSALQKLCQCYGANKAQQRPGESDIEIKILSGGQPKDGAESHYDYTQDIDSHGSVRGAGATTYPVQA
jgi:hypothetical protein